MKEIHRQRGAGIIAALAAIVVFSLLGASLNQMHQSATRSTTGQHTGSNALLAAEAGLEAAARFMAASCAAPPTLPFVLNATIGDDTYAATLTNPSADGLTYLINATGSSGNARRTLQRIVTCPAAGGGGGNLFDGTNGGQWMQQDLLNDDGNLVLSDPQCTNRGCRNANNLFGCSNSRHNSSCMRARRNPDLDLPYEPGEDILLSTRFAPPPPEDARFSMLTILDNGVVILCGSNGEFGVNLSTPGTITCQQWWGIFLISTTQTTYTPSSGELTLNLGRFNPNDIWDIRMGVSNWPDGGQLTLNNPCMGSGCSGGTGGGGSFQSGEWAEPIR